jgi:POT family proton-dependent oligopeptide transporter
MSLPTTRTGKHPKALYVLFLTEMWERFAYYLIAGILLLYLLDDKTGGKGMTASTAADITGSFIALIWLPPFIGGLIADRYLGYIKSIFIGGSLLAAGYLGLTLPGDTAMYISLGLIIVGNGFFKPNISTLLGNIYNREDLKPLKDNAYNIFYMGINIGALFCNFVAAYLRNKYGWGYAFGAAGIGMIIALITFGLNLSKVREGNVRRPAQPEDMPLSRMALYVLAPALVCALIGYFLPAHYHITIMGSHSSDAFIFACVPVILYFISLWARAKGEDKKGIGALLFIFAASVIFWALYYQNFTAYTLWAERHTDRSLNSPVVRKLADSWGLMQTVSTTPRETEKLDDHLMPVKDDSGHVLKTIGPDLYYNNIPREKWPPPGEEHKLANAELYQSIGPFFIVTLTPLLVLLFSWLRKRNKEPTTPAKFGIALFTSGLSSLLMVFAVLSVPSIYHYKVSAGWLWGTYFIITVAEVFLSPMGLSLVSKLAPPRLTSLLMGGWFLTMSLGGKIAGLMTSAWDKFPDKRSFFLVWFAAAMIGGILIFSRIKSLNRIVREKTGEA